ncbi:hypothetical protein F441_01747 [Phytophthora nicotianae CJ01A1]|uniref:Uncharacterized protein n=5 Tax=Phytophthora nicotianae TaxID=4792 RepID=V9FXR0_PHYNI|nr:hypothetical protein F443_01780 [Phytophthora nicotianae P1569]ETK95365.1 hypothetical protein L915_01697 [Phytophthora nicotianae]ETO84322.1 hypothetical protein F444_01783 [Phytophthora nicotianae P1976]ETP25355.1 hypothetical protein F441_01747 [Phytophthora nicotianae CJ01A1]ETP53367.1 hypothetical protein F442_01722 [Phytophthora nicotianae P10297]
MELINRLRNALLQQQEDKVLNFFTKVSDLRDFISAREPTAGVNVTNEFPSFSLSFSGYTTKYGYIFRKYGYTGGWLQKPRDNSSSKKYRFISNPRLSNITPP